MKNILYIVILISALPVQSQSYGRLNSLAHTFSIVARDELTGELAVAVQSHWFSVGTSVSWAEAGTGAIATQSFINKSFGPRGLALLKSGLNAKQVLDSLLASDDGREVRQLAIVDARGNIAAFTGKDCIPYASHITGEQFSVQSNMMLGNKVCESMAAAFRQSRRKPLAERMLLALEAGQLAGGDIRGKQSSALIVVPGISQGKPWEERPVDLRVDDNPDPIRELRRLYGVHLAFEHMNAGDLAVEKNNMALAMQEYGEAMKRMPTNLEMKYWTAIALANNREIEKAIPLLKEVFSKDKNWKELTRRLPGVKLLNLSEKDLRKILSL